MAPQPRWVADWVPRIAEIPALSLVGVDNPHTPCLIEVNAGRGKPT